MCWLKVLLILFSLLCMGHCDDKGIGGYGHGHHHLHCKLSNIFFIISLIDTILLVHEFYYLIFLAIKFKIILIVGSIWAFGLIAAKIFALFKLADYYKRKYQ